MIEGIFDGYGRPYLQGRLSFPNLNIDGHIEFMIDTGADATLIHPKDARQLNIPLDELDYSESGEGVGGIQRYAPELATVTFLDNDELRDYRFFVAIAEPGSGVDSLPSVLGRDILNQWHMSYDPMNDHLGFIVGV